MTTQQKVFWGGVVVLSVLGGLAWFGWTPFLHVIDNSTTTNIAGSPTGTTFNTAKVAAINMAPSSASATSTSILNGDASDRIVTDGFATCSGVGSAFAQTGAGLLVWNLTAATTSTNAPANLTSSGLAAINMTVATSTSDAYAATTTYTNTFSRRWNTGTYMTFVFNGTTTSGVACNVGVHYLGL